MTTPSVTERTFYPALLKLIADKGGAGVQEVEFNSVPDILFNFLDRRWILSVKLGESPGIVKDAFVQYLRHKEESGLEHGLLLLLPESLRTTQPTESDVYAAVIASRVAVLIDAGPYKDEVRDRAFSQVLDLLKTEFGPLIARGVAKHYPLALVIDLLRTQVIEVMDQLSLREEAILKIVTDRKLLTDLGRLSKKEADEVARFLAAYIIISQILFLRLLAVVRRDVLGGSGPMTRTRLRQAFNRVLNINYRPIYELDVLDAVGDKYIRDTFDLIWGLEVERVRYELPGRVFHDLMPSKIRKLLAAFYTRPQAAALLARLTVTHSTDSVFDPASGSGTILVAAYREKLRLHEAEGRGGSPHKRFCEDEIFGGDIMPFAVHLTSANLAAMNPAETIGQTQIIQDDSLDLFPGTTYKGSLQLRLFPAAKKAKKASGEEYSVKLGKVDVVVMNPPFTKVERGIKKYVDMNRFKEVAGGEVGLWGHFIFLADEFLEEGGVYGAVLPSVAAVWFIQLCP